jgi:hypothetical protein
LGWIAIAQDDYTTARTLFGESLTLRQEMGDKSGISRSLGSLGHVALALADYATARSSYEECLMIGKELDVKPIIT